MWKKFKGFAEFCGFMSLLWGAFGMLTNPDGSLYRNADNLNITYDFIYTGLLAIGVVTIAYVFTQFCFFLYENRDRFKTSPEKSITDAIDYIIRDSHYGTGLGLNEEGVSDACASLNTLIKRKKLTLFGVTPDNPTLHIVDKKLIKNAELVFTHNISSSNLSGFHMNAQLELRRDNENIEYKNFFLSKKQLKREFPHKYGH